MEVQLYTELKAHLQNTLGARLKKIDLWNNQFEHSNNPDLRGEFAFNYPALYIEFRPSNFNDLSSGVQEFDLDIDVHIGFSSFKGSEMAGIEILQLKQDIHRQIQRFACGNFDLLSRREQIQNFDHHNVQEYIITYTTRGTDRSNVRGGTVEVQADLNLSATTASFSAITINY